MIAQALVAAVYYAILAVGIVLIVGSLVLGALSGLGLARPPRPRRGGMLL